MKYTIASLEEVAEGLRSEYELKDGKFVLKVEGDIPTVIAANAKVVEFRDKNIALLKEVDQLRPVVAKFEGIDPDEAKNAIEKVKTLGKKGIADADDFDAKVRLTVDELVKPLRDQVAASAAETLAERKRADDFLLSSTIGDKFGKVGGRAKAVDQVVSLARENFEVKDGKVAAKTGKFSAEKPGDPLPVEEWLGTVAKDYDFLFEPSGGGGARPGTGGGAPAKKEVRPGVTIIKNPTPQELGSYAADAKAGKVKFEYDETVKA